MFATSCCFRFPDTNAMKEAYRSPVEATRLIQQLENIIEFEQRCIADGWETTLTEENKTEIKHTINFIRCLAYGHLSRKTKFERKLLKHSKLNPERMGQKKDAKNRITNQNSNHPHCKQSYHKLNCGR